MLTDEHLLVERSNRGAGGTQRIYRFPSGAGLSVVNGQMLHSFPYAWEVAVLKGVRDDGDFDGLDYSTPLTDDVMVFMSDDETNAFILHAASVLSIPEVAKP